MAKMEPVEVNVHVHTDRLDFLVDRLEKAAERFEPAQLDYTNDFRNLVKSGVMPDITEHEDYATNRHPLSEKFHALLREAGDLHDKKQADYGRDHDPFANVRASENWEVKPWVGAMVRANDKVARLQSFVQNGNLVNESARDSLMDIAVYSLIAIVLMEEEDAS